LDVLRLLLEAGFSPSCQDADGWTPMHAAAHWEQIDACRYLAAYGANFNLRNKLGQKPVDVADDSLIPEFTKLQKSRPKKENLPSLPELPPRSPTSFLPEPPQDSPPPVVSTF
jgi:ankyrin repeat protein